MSQVQTGFDSQLQQDPAANAAAASPAVWLLLLLLALAAGLWWATSRQQAATSAGNAPAVATVDEATTPATPDAAANARADAATAAASKSRSRARPAAARNRGPAPIASTQVMPRYPASALRAGDSGTVLVLASIDANGVPVDVSLDDRSGNRELDRAALRAVRQWRFTPALHDGKPVASSVRVPVQFALQG